ncbi:hypothetical protein CDCA_CDCA16G4183 [Cyanidium caldarium]|uniref:CN hydrolase domain-containing protein n=1 Tax=Cyanidium caldarium TaxID=2771 RepID=A0AAV9J286_CYACA|nr:hypothetical protein CDCA_CDCA16G4183 [Cyanidium caldarium]
MSLQRQLVLAAVQFAVKPHDPEANVAKACALVRSLPRGSATLILLPELFAAQYFPQDGGEPAHFRLAVPSPHTEPQHPFWQQMLQLADEVSAALAVSFFERAGLAHFNSLALIDPHAPPGQSPFLAPVYRKLHIPHSPGYHEKFYFSPGDTPPTVYTLAAHRVRVGVGICWDQWFPELARCLALQGAEVLLYPTAIGSEPQDPQLDSCGHWRRTQQGHAAANMVPLVAANRVGVECASDGSSKIRFYGSSFITDNTGAIVAEAGRDEPDKVIVGPVMELEQYREARLAWGIFRDRRPDMYGAIRTLDGSTTTR